MVPKAQVYYVQAENAISMHGTEEEFATAERILRDVDRPKKVYRLTYTITESDGGKQLGTERAALIVSPQGQSVLKQGSRVPIVTGKTDAGSSSQSSQVQYLDVGLTIETSLDGTRLQTKIEQTSLSEDKSGLGVQDPVVLQSKLETISILTPGKALVLGSFDVPGSTRHKDVEVLAEAVE
jgi:type II secretory pathway component GspD/PulD (secretin)